MSIVFRQPGEPRKYRVPILTIPPERRIRLLGTPVDHVQVYLHFTGPYSVPCLGDDCDLCETPPLLFGYAAVAEYILPRSGKWIVKPAILPVTEGCIDILETDLRDRVFVVNRRRNLPTGAMEVRVESAGGAAGIPMFDVKERLLALWQTRSRDGMGKPSKIFYSHEEEEGDSLRFGT